MLLVTTASQHMCLVYVSPPTYYWHMSVQEYPRSASGMVVSSQLSCPSLKTGHQYAVYPALLPSGTMHPYFLSSRAH